MVRRLALPLCLYVGVRRLGGFREFLVQDSGIGTEHHFYDLIFFIFQRLRVKDAYPGVGNGLAIVKKVVDRHGGTDPGRICAGRGLDLFRHPAGQVPL